MQSSPALASDLKTVRGTTQNGIQSPAAHSFQTSSGLDASSFVKQSDAQPVQPKGDAAPQGVSYQRADIESSYRSRLERLVAARPMTSALVATAVGAFAMAVLLAWSKERVKKVRSNWTRR